MTHACRAMLSLILSAWLGVYPGVMAAELAAEDRDQDVLAEFPVFVDGDVLLVPVTVAGKKRTFVLDTGFSTTTFDPRLDSALTRTGTAAERNIRVAGAGTMELALAGEFAIEGLSPYRGRRVWRGDLTNVRESTGHDVDGILGIDVLRPFVVQIDVDQSRLRFLSKPPSTDARAIPLSRRSSGVPVVLAAPAQGVAQDFIVDTGMYSLDVAVDLAVPLYQQLERRGVLKTLYRTPSATVDQLRETRTGVLPDLSITGGPTVKNVRATEHLDGLNLLGLSFLLRFNTVLDLPNDRLLITPRQRQFETQFPVHGSGATLLRRDGVTFVHSVRERSRADKAGIHRQDILDSVVGRAAKDFRLHTLRLSLETAGPDLEMTVHAPGAPQRRIVLSREDAP